MRWGAARFRRDRAPERLSARWSPAPTAEHPFALGRAGGKPALWYSAAHRHWWLWWPCQDCGGARLPLRGRGNGRPPVHAVRAAAAADRCPGCETRRRRAKVSGPEPAVWYDTLLCDWVVRLSGTVVLPLELRWFDVSEVAVYRSAGDLAYLGDAFEREPGEEP